MFAFLPLVISDFKLASQFHVVVSPPRTRNGTLAPCSLCLMHLDKGLFFDHIEEMLKMVAQSENVW